MQRCLIQEKSMAADNCKDPRRKLLVGVDLFCLFLVMLVAVFLHKSPMAPYRRGFFCSDNSISVPFKSSTVSTTLLTSLGVSVPVVSLACLSWSLRPALCSLTVEAFTAETSPSSTPAKTWRHH
ncbi:phospholipid phosphatase 3-like [Entelurus aequoreus]|uniref:phospholipid phosphatase 3-like n=1 Tax=Entelurus aequoreus TaxID=161455 RepID=UPI002B1CE821|nr:phospholipid phosphatase 3-like [Entelurus aequoreus]